MARLIKKVGPMRLKPELKQSPFAALVEAIVYQQLHGKAAATIFKRVLVLFPKRKFPKPEDFLNTPDKTLRSAGLSGAKTAAIKDLSQKMLDGVIPTLKQIEKMTDDEIVERISSVRGIGRWTVEMLLIFKLGRPDVLPATDFAIRKAFGQIYKQKEMPPPKAILEFGEIWRPHRTTAAWYLWRSLDL
ncbi:MAG: alkA [Bacteriovoracaceae bacterium]|nr:alkA [Bacteriovoracaceae bacterium]